ncbi:MAG: hypothetical protein MHMPM18_001225 [Marteilia pararefringens]
MAIEMNNGKKSCPINPQISKMCKDLKVKSKGMLNRCNSTSRILDDNKKSTWQSEFPEERDPEKNPSMQRSTGVGVNNAETRECCKALHSLESRMLKALNKLIEENELLNKNIMIIMEKIQKLIVQKSI